MKIVNNVNQTVDQQHAAHTTIRVDIGMILAVVVMKTVVPEVFHWFKVEDKFVIVFTGVYQLKPH